MSFGFSIGDFLTVGSLIVEVIFSLKQTGGSVRHYQDLILELEGLRNALLQIDRLVGPDELQPTIHSIKITALKCRFFLQEFQTQARKYDRSLGLGNTAGKFKDAHMKIRWGLWKKEAVDELRVKVNAHVGSISMLLGLYRVKYAGLQAETQKDIKEHVAVSNAALQKTKSVVLTANQSITTIRNALNLQISWVQNELKPSLKSLFDIAKRIVAINLAIFEILEKLYNGAPSIDTKHTWFQDPIHFEDAVGRRFSVPSEYTWDMLEGVFKTKFVNGPGRRPIDDGFYHIYYADSPSTLISKAGSNDLMPGKRVIMAMLFIESGETRQCPRCHSKDFFEDPLNVSICITCSLRFDIRNIENLPLGPKSDPADFLLIRTAGEFALGGLTTLQNLALLMGIRRSTTRTIVDVQQKCQPYEDIEHFRNIRIQTVGLAQVNAIPTEAGDFIGRLALRHSNRHEETLWQYTVTEEATWPPLYIERALEAAKAQARIEREVSNSGKGEGC